MRLNEIELDNKEQIDLFQGVKGIYALAGIDKYSTVQEEPKFLTNPINLLISLALNLDYVEDVVNNKKIDTLEKGYKEDIKKYNKSLEEKGEIGYQCLWSNLGDSLTQIVCDFTMKHEANQENKDKLDTLLQNYYNGFMDIINETKYVETDIELNGEKLYRRVR